MGTDPFSQLNLIDAASRDIQHEADDFALIRHEPMAVQAEKDVHDLKRGALVAIDVCVILGDTYTVGGRTGGEVGGRIIGPPLQGPVKSRLE